MTDTAKTTSPTRETIRESWVNYVGNITYDLTRAAVDFFLESALKEMSVYAKTTSETNNTTTDKFKNLVGTFTDFVRPKTLAMSNAIGSAASYVSKKSLGNIIGQFYYAAKEQSYELDAKNRGSINQAVTAFARKNVKYMVFGSLAAGIMQPFYSVSPAFLTENIGATFGSLLAGSGLGLLGNQITPAISQFASKFVTKKSKQPELEEKLQDNQEPKPERTLDLNQPLAPEKNNSLEDQPTKKSTPDLEIKLDLTSKEESEPTQVQTPTFEAINHGKFAVHLSANPLPTEEPTAVTKASEDLIPLTATLEEVSDAENEEENAILQHQARYFTPNADMRRNGTESPQHTQYNHDLDSDQAQEANYDNNQSREEGEYSSEHSREIDNENDQLDHSHSNDASSHSSRDSSRSPSPKRGRQYRRIR